MGNPTASMRPANQAVRRGRRDFRAGGGAGAAQGGIDATVYESHATTADDQGGTLMLAPNGLDALRINSPYAGERGHQAPGAMHGLNHG